MDNMIEWPFPLPNEVHVYDNANPLHTFHEDYKQGDEAVSYADRMDMVSYDAVQWFNELN